MASSGPVNGEKLSIRVLNRDAAGYMLKDLGLAMESALATGSATPLGSLARNLYAMHSQSGHGALDFSSIIRQFLKSAA